MAGDGWSRMWYEAGMSHQAKARISHQLLTPHCMWAGIAPQQQIDATLSINTNCSLLCGWTCGKNPRLSGIQEGHDRGWGKAQESMKGKLSLEFSLET